MPAVYPAPRSCATRTPTRRRWPICSAAVVDKLRQSARPYLYSTGLSPGDTAAALAAVEALAASDEPVRRLWDNARLFRSALTALGLEPAGQTPIVPLILFDEQRTQEVARRLFEAGVYAAPGLHHRRASAWWFGTRGVLQARAQERAYSGCDPGG